MSAILRIVLSLQEVSGGRCEKYVTHITRRRKVEARGRAEYFMNAWYLLWAASESTNWTRSWRQGQGHGEPAM